MFRLQEASDAERDGLGVELVDEVGDIVAEVFRSDSQKTVMVSVFSKGVPLVWMEQLLLAARGRLACFGDGSPLPESRSEVG